MIFFFILGEKFTKLLANLSSLKLENSLSFTYLDGPSRGDQSLVPAPPPPPTTTTTTTEGRQNNSQLFVYIFLLKM